MVCNWQVLGLLNVPNVLCRFDKAFGGKEFWRTKAPPWVKLFFWLAFTIAYGPPSVTSDMGFRATIRVPYVIRHRRR
jgi:hypothetical protein